MQLYEPSHGSRAKYDAFIRVWENEITCACMHASGWGLQVIKTVCPLWICKEHVPVELESQYREVCLACLWSTHTPHTLHHRTFEGGNLKESYCWMMGSTSALCFFLFLHPKCVCVCAHKSAFASLGLKPQISPRRALCLTLPFP